MGFYDYLNEDITPTLTDREQINVRLSEEEWASVLSVLEMSPHKGGIQQAIAKMKEQCGF